MFVCFGLMSSGIVSIPVDKYLFISIMIHSASIIFPESDATHMCNVFMCCQTVSQRHPTHFHLHCDSLRNSSSSNNS